MKTKLLKIISAIALIAMLSTVFASCMGTGSTVKASDANGTYEGFNWTFEADDLTLTVTGSGEMKNFADVNAVAWKEVRSTAKKIVIAEGITSVADYAFSYFTILEEVVLPSTVTKIGKSAFEGCTALKSAELPEAVASVGDRAFYACKVITSITIKGNATLGTDVAKYCPALKNVYVPAAIVEAVKAVLSKDVTVKAYDPSAPVTPPAEEETDSAETESTTDTEAETDKNEDDNKLDLGGIIAIVVMSLVIIGVVVAVIIYVRKDKKSSKNGTTVVKKDKNEKKEKNGKKK